MRVRSSLHANLSGESKAYGYTLCIWGSGAVLIAEHGLPATLEVLAVAFGAVLGFAILALLAYGSVFREIEISSGTEDPLIAASMVHLIASLGTIIIAAGIARIVPDPVWGFFLAGVNASVSYNIGLLLEVGVYRRFYEWEQRLLGG